MAKRNKYYAVWIGRETGVFDSWEICKQHIDNFKGAKYKGFPTEKEAIEAFKAGPPKPAYRSRSTKAPSWKRLPPKEQPLMPSLSVDAASSGNPGTMEYQGVDTSNGVLIFRQGPFEEATNNIGEFLALVHGLAHLKKINSTSPIYTDSRTALAWVRKKKCNTKLSRSPQNKAVFDLITRAEHWLNTNAYHTKILKWDTKKWGEIPADFGRK